jgi:drug/metabolite transporter (DMT)-like permease
MRRRESGVLWIACGATLWGTDTVLRRPLSMGLGPVQIVFYEHLILSLAALPILIRYRSYLGKLQGRQWAALAGIAWIGSALATVLFTAAVHSGSPSTAVLLQKTQPFFALVLARGILGERWPRAFPWIAAVGIIGAYLVAFGGNLWRPADSAELWPALLACGAAVGWAFATIWGRILTIELPFELVTALRFLCALPALFIAALVQDQTGIPSSIQFVALLWLALLPGFAGMLLYYRGLRQTPAFQATIAELAFPATAVLLNWVVLSVSVNLVQVLGFSLIWICIACLSRLKREAGAQSPATGRADRSFAEPT